MPSPRSHIALKLIAASALALSAATPAFAKSDVAARSAAISACRAAVAASLQPETPSLRLETLHTGGRVIDVRYSARKDGVKVGVVDCAFSRSERTTTLATIEPATQTAAAPTVTEAQPTAK